MKKLLVVTAFAVAAPQPAHAGAIMNIVGRGVQGVFQKLAMKKGDRVFHAAGQAYHATVERNGHTMPAIVRVSRGGAGKPGNPDILGVAVKFGSGAHEQDFLMVTAKGDHGLQDRIPTEQRNFANQTISSLLSFQGRGMKGAITAKLPADFHTPLDLDASKVGGKQSFDVSIAQGGIIRRAQSKELAKVTVDFDRPLSTEASKTLHFTPWDGGKGVTPAGWINGLRKFAYRGSQAGRGLSNP